jgi:RHS repeat-associated protein
MTAARLWDKDPDGNVAEDLLLKAEYQYDVFGNRIQKQVDEDGDSTIDLTERYAYDGGKPGSGFVGNENGDIWADLDDGGSLTTRYFRGDVIDQLFARISAEGDAYWLLPDRQGSIRDILDDEGTVVDSLTYDGFGNVTEETAPALTGRYTYTGRERDVETGLLYYRARHYDPATGRMVSEDPLGFDAGDSNLYRYVMNGPTNGTDPSGAALYASDEWIKNQLWDLFSEKRNDFLYLGALRSNLFPPDSFGLNSIYCNPIGNGRWIIEARDRAEVIAFLQGNREKLLAMKHGNFGPTIVQALQAMLYDEGKGDDVEIGYTLSNSGEFGRFKDIYLAHRDPGNLANIERFDLTICTFREKLFFKQLDSATGPPALEFPCCLAAAAKRGLFLLAGFPAAASYVCPRGWDGGVPHPRESHSGPPTPTRLGQTTTLPPAYTASGSPRTPRYWRTHSAPVVDRRPRLL